MDPNGLFEVFICRLQDRITYVEWGKQAISDDGSYLSYNAWPTYTGDHVLGMRKGKMTFITTPPPNCTKRVCPSCKMTFITPLPPKCTLHLYPSRPRSAPCTYNPRAG